MKHVFDCHNELGPFFDEGIYQADMVLRIAQAGVTPVRAEVPIELTWKSFRKAYYPDLIICDGALYEFKTKANLLNEHQTQTLNYMLLVGLHEGKLVNFRPPSVQWRFVSTTLTPAIRRNFAFCVNRFREVNRACATMRVILGEILSDWGAYLELALYQEALIWLLGGESLVLRKIPLIRNGVLLGHQTLPLLTEDVAFKMTAATDHTVRVENHLRRFLALTPLRALQWINFNHARIELVTLVQ